MKYKKQLLFFFFSTIFTNSLLPTPIDRTKFITDIGTQLCISRGLTRIEDLQNQQPLKPTFELPKWKDPILQEWDKWHLIFDLLNKHATTHNLPISTIIDPIFIKKMELFCGGENPANSLFNQIDRTHTFIGKACLSFKLISPTTDLKLLRSTQAVIQEIIHNDQTRQNFDNSFKKIAEQSENKLILLWQPSSNILNEQFIQSQYSAFNSFNKNSTYLEATNRLMAFFGYLSGAMGSAVIVVAPIVGFESGEFDKVIAGFFTSAYAAFSMYIVLKQILQMQQAQEHIENQTFAVANYIKECKKIDKIIQKNALLRENIPAAQILHDIVSGNSPTLSADFKEVLYNFNTTTFYEKPFYFSHHGRILATYYMLRETKDELIPLIMAMGEIEAYLSVAKLYKETENKETRYAFVKFVEKTKNPLMDITNFWNPSVNAEQVVLNSFALGTNSTARNAVITGPNTGGKSTVLKALLIDMLMAQTFGIAPAQKITITPFNLINCYLNITDDIATGTSLFKAEVLRAKMLINAIRALPLQTFSFTIMDEVFSGTSPKEGEEAAFLFTQKLATHKNSMTVIATHFPQLTTLPEATDNGYSNHHVEVIRNDDGTLTRTFLLKEGPSFLNVAMDILTAEGVLDY